MARGDQILRHWNLLRMLQTRGGGLSLRDIASELEVTERTVQRDFELLQEAGFPIEYEEDEFGKRYWRMPHDFFSTGPLVISLTEAVSLHLAEDLFAPLAGTLFADGLRSVLDKVHSLLPARALEYFRELDQTVYVRQRARTDYSHQADIIRVLTEATRANRIAEVTYRSLWRDDQYTTRFDPYGLVFYDGDLFLVGHSHKADGLRIFKVARILGTVTTDDTFDRPADFELESHFRSAFGIVRGRGEPQEVVVRFTGAAAALVDERLWHETQKLEWLPPESTLFETPDEPHTLLATFRLSNFVELKRWLLSFGEHAEVLRPATLRSEMLADLRAAARRYED